MLQERALAARRDDPGRYSLASGRVHVGDDYARALARERQRRLAADALRAPGDDRDLA
ncbi:hypothetical protein HNP73_003116 [Amaricoccus macauensis]|uniref:Uncharacterized protein n=1 Tax=Amaricoccus macauensis TaxID=57001 RepID=A0A840SJA3_9RHOB|nr:hypothetical protein [Amaricoccus macauensis]